MNLFTINGNDLFSTYGFVVESGTDDLLRFPKRKDPLTTDFPDENGIEVDLSEPRFKNKEINIVGLLLAISENDFWAKHRGLFSVLSSPDLLRLYSDELGRSFFIYYSDCTALSRLTRIKYAGQEYVSCQYKLAFVEPVPSFWKVFSYLITNNNKYINTPSGQRILV